MEISSGINATDNNASKELKHIDEQVITSTISSELSSPIFEGNSINFDNSISFEEEHSHLSS